MFNLNHLHNKRNNYNVCFLLLLLSLIDKAVGYKPLGKKFQQIKEIRVKNALKTKIYINYLQMTSSQIPFQIV